MHRQDGEVCAVGSRRGAAVSPIDTAGGIARTSDQSRGTNTSAPMMTAPTALRRTAPAATSFASFTRG